jgi:hypothetical protein
VGLAPTSEDPCDLVADKGCRSRDGLKELDGSHWKTRIAAARARDALSEALHRDDHVTDTRHNRPAYWRVTQQQDLRVSYGRKLVRARIGDGGISWGCSGVHFSTERAICHV